MIAIIGITTPDTISTARRCFLFTFIGYISIDNIRSFNFLWKSLVNKKNKREIKLALQNISVPLVCVIVIVLLAILVSKGSPQSEHSKHVNPFTY